MTSLTLGTPVFYLGFFTGLLASIILSSFTLWLLNRDKKDKKLRIAS